MKTNYLLPYKYKFLGWVLFSVGILTGIFVLASNYESNFFTIKVLSVYYEPHGNITLGKGLISENSPFLRITVNDILDELACLLIIVGGLIIGFTEEKIEDEFTYKLRKDSLVWAMIFNYSILLLAILFVYGMEFFHILVFNMFTPLIFFIVRFNYLKFKANSHEE